MVMLSAVKSKGYVEFVVSVKRENEMNKNCLKFHLGFYSFFYYLKELQKKSITENRKKKYQKIF
jgi:hypothetical protein